MRIGFEPSIVTDISTEKPLEALERVFLLGSVKAGK